MRQARDAESSSNRVRRALLLPLGPLRLLEAPRLLGAQGVTEPVVEPLRPLELLPYLLVLRKLLGRRSALCEPPATGTPPPRWLLGARTASAGTAAGALDARAAACAVEAACSLSDNKNAAPLKMTPPEGTSPPAPLLLAPPLLLPTRGRLSPLRRSTLRGDSVPPLTTAKGTSP